jgi:type I restriction enzyme S subunit
MINEKKIPSGYKASPFGTIPSDWDVKELKDVCLKIQDGNYGGEYPKMEEFIEKGIPFLTSKAIGGEGEINEQKIDFITPEKHAQLKKAQLKLNDILFTNRGANVGTIGLVDERIAHGNIGPQLTLLRSNEGIVYYMFLKETMKSFIVQNQVRTQDSGSAMNFFGIGDTSKFKLLIPPLPEQTAIANLLSTWDKAIQTTNTLIEQKQNRKKWLMQMLLTGKRRLKGFEKEKWVKLGAGEVFESFTKKGFETEELLSATQDRGIIPRSMLVGRVTMPEGTTAGYKLVEPGDFVISLRSFQGGLEYSNYRGIVSPAYIVLKPKKKICEEFYKQYYKSYEFIGRLATAVIGIRDGKQISYDDYCLVRIPYPSYEEQIEISKVLQVSDKEIQLLQNKLDQLKEQKKGLMQILLTGKKRLKVN